jgi:hypothetical protein
MAESAADRGEDRSGDARGMVGRIDSARSTAGSGRGSIRRNPRLAASRRGGRGETLGVPHGREEVDQADRWMAAQKIKNPARMASMIVTPWS